MTKSVWETLSRIDVGQHVEKKNGFSYLSWAWAWQTLKDHYPDATFTKHLHPDTHLPYFRDDATGNAFVRVTVRAGGDEQTEDFPVLDYSNKAIDTPNSFQINTALQRCMAKAISYLGLGAYIYAGEDLPPVSSEVKLVDGDEVTDVKGAENVMAKMVMSIPNKLSQDALEAFWTQNKKALDLLKQEQPDEYQRLLALFKKQKRKITDDKAA